MTESPRLIFIVGAGISGLTLALTLAKFGVRVVVIERQSEIKTEGAGIQLSPNARHVLNQLGLERALDKVAFAPEAIDLYPFRRAKPLSSFRLGDLARDRFGCRYDVIHRGDLLDSLYSACKRFANIDIQLGVESFDIEQHARGVSVLYENNRQQTQSARPFAIVGADGVHSTVRREFLDGPEAKYSGRVAWRTLLPLNADLPFAKDRTTLLWGPGFHAVLYPLPIRSQINVALFTKQSLKSIQRGTVETDPKLPKPLYRSEYFRAILENSSGWAYWPLYAVKAANWFENEIGLIGDAAHAMLPFQAQGAAMGIEDAAELAPLLVTEQSARSAFSTYQSARQKRVNKVQSISARNGFAFHLEWPFTLGRDFVIATTNPKTHFERLAWIYDHKSFAEPEMPVLNQPDQNP